MNRPGIGGTRRNQRLRRFAHGGLLALLVPVCGCFQIYIPAGPGEPMPAPPIDFDRAHELMALALDVTQNFALTSADLRQRYDRADRPASVYSVVFPGDDGESRFMLLTDPALRTQTLVLGGTNTYLQWQIDAQVAPAYQADLDANIHSGWNFLSLQVLNVVLPDLRSDYELTITGFSLGAAMATITSNYLTLAGYDVTEVVTFGQPRVTDTAGVTALRGIPITRFVNDEDPFPHVKGAGVDATHFGRMVLLFDGPYFAFVPDGDPLLQAESRPFGEFREDEFNYHSETLYLSRLNTLRSQGTRVLYQP